MSNEMKTNYKGTEIVYFEGSNEFVFTLRGRTRRAMSLTKAKEAIDAPPPKDKKPFTRIEAWWKRGFGGSVFKKVSVTSLSDKPGWRGIECWILDGGQRSKESASELYPVNDRNDQIVEEINALRKERDAIDRKMETAQKRLQNLGQVLKDVEVE